jgi:hypothetical protein
MNTNKYMGRHHYGNWIEGPYMSEDEKVTRWGLAIVIAVVVFLASSIAWGEKGMKDAMHRGPVPAKVTMLAGDLYLIADGAAVSASDICLDAASGEEPVQKNVRVKDLDVDLVQCYQEQKWNVKLGPAQSFVPDGVVHTATEPWFWGLLGALLVVFFPYGYLRAAWKISKQHKVAATAERKQLEEAKAILIAQWSKSGSLDLDDPGYISDKDFEKRLGELDEKIRRGV